MNLFRQRVSGVNREKLRSLAARTGWLVDAPDELRAGFGGAIRTQTITAATSGETLTVLGDLEVSGDGECRPFVFASSPFEPGRGVRLWLPAHELILDRHGDGWLISTTDDASAALALIDATAVGTTAPLTILVDRTEPSPAQYERAVLDATNVMKSNTIQKVVLAQRVSGHADSDFDPANVTERMRQRDPDSTIYSLPALEVGRHVGASPELLASIEGGKIYCRPLAGTAWFTGDGATAEPHEVLASPKIGFEHRVVVDDILERLRAIGISADADSAPSVLHLRDVAHLATAIRGSVTSASRSALDVLFALQPTPAVGGLPRERAVTLIAELETNDRGLYAGAAGWIDGGGDGQWWVAIRGAEIAGREFTVWAGSGIVADSEPASEAHETASKVATIIGGLGVLAA